MTENLSMAFQGLLAKKCRSDIDKWKYGTRHNRTKRLAQGINFPSRSAPTSNFGVMTTGREKSELNFHRIYTTWFPFLVSVFSHDLGELNLTIGD